MKIYAAAMCVVGAVIVSACGGGGDSATPAAPTPAAPAPAPAGPPIDQFNAAALRLYESAWVHASLAASPLVYALFYRDEVWTSGPCALGGNGSLQVSLDGVSPAKGTVLPPGSHKFAVTFANCLVDGLVGISLNGTASADYTTGISLNDLTALVSTNSMRGTGSLGFRSDLYDVTVEGSGTWTRVRTSTASTTTYTPHIGSILVNNSTTNVATFGGGSYSSSYDDPPPPGSSASGHQEFNNLAVAINGTRYILSGTLHSVYGFASSQSQSHTGEVRITSNGALVARVYGEGAFRVEVYSPLIPL